MSTASMTTADTFDSPGPVLHRDRFGRPLIIPPGGGKPTPYTRCTTYIGALEDTYNLGRWQQRMVALGLAVRPDLVGLIHAKRDDKAALNALCDDAIEAAKGSAAANTGTALHAMTETIDRGQELGQVPVEFAADVAAYIATRDAAGLDVISIEEFSVLDDLKIGGTPDRVYRLPAEHTLPDGDHCIGDVKTGGIEYGIGKIAMQLAVYAHSQPYDVTTGQRRPHPPGLSMTRALIVHLPAGTGTCRLLWVDIEAGWEAVQLATRVREWRKRKNLTHVLDVQIPTTDPIAAAIAAAGTVPELEAVYTRNAAAWTEQHTTAAKVRKAALA